MTGNELYEPLRRRAGRKRPRPPLLVIVAVLGAGVVALAAAAILRQGGAGGEPFAVATIERVPPPSPAAPARAAPTGDATPTGTVAPGTVAVPEGNRSVEIENGVTIVRLAANTAGPGPIVLKVPDAAPPGEALARAPDPRLVEPSGYGPLPRIGRDGARPDRVYARPSVPPVENRPRIAIMIGGMGLDRAATAEAGTRLPGVVTFGFAPYGDDVTEQVRQARAAGHEVVLQVPMEGFGQGGGALSHMLLTEGRNTDRLRWLLGRFTGYAGLSNYLGGRLLADQDALRPIFQETAARGLFFVDDGSAARSLAGPVAADLGLPAARADVVLDASPDPSAVVAALARLETMARERGLAIGTATGRPETVALLAPLLAEAGKRGIVLIPISQAVAAGGPNRAAATTPPGR